MNTETIRKYDKIAFNRALQKFVTGLDGDFSYSGFTESTLKD